LQTSETSYNLSNGILEPMASLTTDEIYAGSGDLWFQGGPVVVFGEGYYRRIRPLAGGSYSSAGAWGQVAVGLCRNVVAAGLRGGWIDPDLAIAHNDAFEIEGQVAYYIDAPNLVLKTRYA